MSRFAVDEPADFDAEPDLRRLDEEAREQRWAQFVHDVKWWGIVCTLKYATELYEQQPKPGEFLSTRQQDMMNFQQTEGWDGILSAIARAMREHEAALVESTDRSTR